VLAFRLIANSDLFLDLLKQKRQMCELSHTRRQNAWSLLEIDVRQKERIRPDIYDGPEYNSCRAGASRKKRDKAWCIHHSIHTNNPPVHTETRFNTSASAQSRRWAI